jgi:hypothetical protein
MRKQHFHVRQRSQALDKELGGLELFALNDEWMTGVFLEDSVIELGDFLAARPIPKLENGRHQPDPRHVVRKTTVGQQIECSGMGRGSAWIHLQGFIDVKQPNRQTATPEQPRAQKADRATSSNQYPPFVKTHFEKLLFTDFHNASYPDCDSLQQFRH